MGLPRSADAPAQPAPSLKLNSSWVDPRKVYGMTRVGPQALVGAGCDIRFPDLVVMRGWSRIDSQSYVSVGLEMEDRTVVCPGAKVIGGASRLVTLRRWSFIGWNCLVMARSEDYEGLIGVGFGAPGPAVEGDITFEPFSGLGSMSSCFPGVTFPEGAVVGAHSMVHSSADLQPWYVHRGVPARPWKRRDRDRILEEAALAERAVR